MSVIASQGQGKKDRKSLFPQCETSIGNNSSSVKHTDTATACMYIQHIGVFGYGGMSDVTAIFVT